MRTRRQVAGRLGGATLAATGLVFNAVNRLNAGRNAFLARNADTFAGAVAAMERVAATPVEGTYLAWLDVRPLGLPNPADWFEAFGLGLSDSVELGAPGFLRFNLGCSRSMLDVAIERLRHAVEVVCRRCAGAENTARYALTRGRAAIVLAVFFDPMRLEAPPYSH